MCIYFILNKINGKYYIGKTTQSLDKRWKQHVYNSTRTRYPINTHFYNAIRKFGSKNFEVRELLQCSDFISLDLAEEYFISFFDSTNKSFGYNCSFGGEGGRKTEEVKRKISLSHKGKKLSENHKRNIGLARIGLKRVQIKKRYFSEETKAKISMAKKGKPWSEKARLAHGY